MNKNNSNKKNKNESKSKSNNESKSKSTNGSTNINNDKKIKNYLKKNNIPYGVILNDSNENFYSNEFYLSNNLDSLECYF